MKIEDCFYFGKIGKAKGLKGDVNIIIDKDSPVLPDKLDKLYIKVGKKLVLYPLTKYSITPKDNAIGKFEGINSDSDVDLIKNMSIYLPKIDLPELDEDDYFIHDLEGCKIIDSIMGEIGTISEVNTQTVQTLLFVDTKSGEIIIPLAKEFIVEIDTNSKTIKLNLPEGLIDLND